MKKKSRGRRKPEFKVQWVKLPQRWMKALQQSKSIGTYQLAHVILFEAFKRQQIGGEIVLSAIMTGMDRSTKNRAIKELVKLRLIRVKQSGKGATRVVDIYY
jgi:hypothetical protein